MFFYLQYNQPPERETEREEKKGRIKMKKRNFEEERESFEGEEIWRIHRPETSIWLVYIIVHEKENTTRLKFCGCGGGKLI
jgi:hypothetical protein